MRVCAMNDNFYRSSGVAMAIRRIADSLPEVDWFFAGCAGDDVREDLSWIDPPDRYERFDLKTFRLVTVASEIRRFRKWMRRNRISLVHCHHRRVAAILHFAGVPVVYTGQLVFPHERWFRWFHPTRMTAITPSVAKNLLETTGQEVLACISNPALFPDEPPAIDLQEVAGQAICIARLDPVKGHKHLLSAWKMLHDRGHNYHLNLVGEGSLRSELEEQAKRDGIAPLVHFLGFKEDVGSAIRKNLFAVLASEYEGQGIVTLEAAAMGRPSLLTAVPGSVDLIPPDASLPNGVPFGDVAALADALELWFADPKQVLIEGRLFFDRLQNSSDPATVGQQYKQVYTTIIGAGA